jgi:hypothetical protein
VVLEITSGKSWLRAYPESVVERFGGQVLQIRPRAPRTGATVLVVLERGPQEAGGGAGVPERQRSGDTFGISSKRNKARGIGPLPEPKARFTA